jgi:uncharacterized membrane protein
MSPLEGRAWLSLWGMCPAYIVYFSLQLAAPAWLATTPEHLICFAVAACTHALIVAVGSLVLKARQREQDLIADERDHAIEARATRTAYLVLMFGTVLVGVVMPFNQGGWKIVNGALLTIVLAEVLRNLLIVLGYRGTPRLAH